MNKLHKMARWAGFDVIDGFVYPPNEPNTMPLDVLLEFFANIVRREYQKEQNERPN